MGRQPRLQPGQQLREERLDAERAGRPGDHQPDRVGPGGAQRAGGAVRPPVHLLGRPAGSAPGSRRSPPDGRSARTRPHPWRPARGHVGDVGRISRVAPMRPPPSNNNDRSGPHALRPALDSRISDSACTVIVPGTRPVYHFMRTRRSCRSRRHRSGSDGELMRGRWRSTRRFGCGLGVASGRARPSGSQPTVGRDAQSRATVSFQTWALKPKFTVVRARRHQRLQGEVPGHRGDLARPAR